MKKNIDIKALLREGLLAAKKQHGILVEREEPELQEAYKRPEQELKSITSMQVDSVDRALLRAVGIDHEFDMVRDMPSISLSKTLSGKEGSENYNQTRVQSSEILFEKIRGGKENPREILQRLTEILGMGSVGGELSVMGKDFATSSEKGLKVDSDQLGDTDLFAAVLLYKTIYDIVRENEAQSAGRIWENFFAQLLGGEAVKLGSTDTIIDVSKGKVKYSLKLVSEGTSITGSKALLIEAIKDHGKIVYIVGTKSKPTKAAGGSGSFYIRFNSFILDETNYMFALTNKVENEIAKSSLDEISGQYAVIWDQLTNADKIHYAERNPLAKKNKAKFNLNSYRNLFKGWIKNPTLDLSEVEYRDDNDPKKNESFKEFKRPIPLPMGESLLREAGGTHMTLGHGGYDMSNEEWLQFAKDSFASGEVTYGPLGDAFADDYEPKSVKLGQARLKTILDAYKEIENKIKSLNSNETDPSKALNILEFFTLYSALFSVRAQRKGAGKVTKEDYFNSVNTAIANALDVKRLVNLVKANPNVSIETLENILNPILRAAELTQLQTFKAALVSLLDDPKINKAMVAKRIITFEDDTERATDLNNQMRALRVALQKRFSEVAKDDQQTKEIKAAAQKLASAIEDYSFNKYEVLQTEQARQIFASMQTLRAEYRTWLRDMRAMQTDDVRNKRRELIIPAAELNISNSYPAFIELVRAYTIPAVLPADKEEQKPEKTAIEPLAGSGQAEDAEVELEKSLKAPKDSTFSLDQSKMISQREFLKVNKEINEGGIPVSVTWPTITLDSRLAFYNAQKSKQALMAYIAPIFEAAFYLSAGAVAYFGKDLDSGLMLAQKSVSYLKDNLAKQQVDIGKVEKEKQTFKEPVAEGLKKDELDDMIDELFK